MKETSVMKKLRTKVFSKQRQIGKLYFYSFQYLRKNHCLKGHSVEWVVDVIVIKASGIFRYKFCIAENDFSIKISREKIELPSE